MTIHLDQVGNINFIQTGVTSAANSIADLRITNNSTSGNAIITFATSGNVGIGTTSPTTALQVVGTVTATGYAGLPVATLSTQGIVQVGSGLSVNAGTIVSKVVNITQSVYSSVSDYNPSTTWTDSPIPSITITPASSSSRFHIRGNVVMSVNGTTTVAFRFVRNGTAVGVGSGGSYQCSFRGQTANPVWANTTSGEYIDSPSTSSAVTYKIQFMTYDIGRTVRFNNSFSGSSADDSVGISTLTITELSS